MQSGCPKSCTSFSHISFYLKWPFLVCVTSGTNRKKIISLPFLHQAQRGLTPPVTVGPTSQEDSSVPSPGSPAGIALDPKSWKAGSRSRASVLHPDSRSRLGHTHSSRINKSTLRRAFFSLPSLCFKWLKNFLCECSQLWLTLSYF